MPQAKTVAIIGAGPIGLAAAAHALEQGLKPIVLEAGPEVGHAVRQWQHVQLFSPWEYNVDCASEWLLAATGWNSPDPKVYATGFTVSKNSGGMTSRAGRIASARGDRCPSDSLSS